MKDKYTKVLSWIADHFFFLIRVMVTLGFRKNRETNESNDNSDSEEEN